MTDESENHPVGDESTLVGALRRGDEAAFRDLIDRYHSSLVRLARLWTRDTAVAEEVAQETWLSVLQGIHGFEARSSLRSWIFGILANKAKRQGIREHRTRPFADFIDSEEAGVSMRISADHFYPTGHPWAGHWNYSLVDEERSPERHVLRDEVGEVIMHEIDRLPELYRGVILLRDLHGFSASESCDMLGITNANQRVILHRARTRLRIELEPYLRGRSDED